jgi:hypothetical protein
MSGGGVVVGWGGEGRLRIANCLRVFNEVFDVSQW